MKVIKAAVDLDTWSLKYSCPNCTSEVEVEATDIFHDWDANNSPWRVTCCLCDHQFRIMEDRIPKLVQADARKNRYISHPVSDW